MAIGVRDGAFSTDAVIATDLKLKGPGWPARSAGRRVLEDLVCSVDVQTDWNGCIRREQMNNQAMATIRPPHKTIVIKNPDTSREG
jgi:hypothetical protein